tara:strand:+ start:1039 stop:1197 length:159 start_codon:yes stop_codon:yes gene_type:complete
MPLELIVVVVLLLILIGVLPAWRHSANWGYGPSGIAGATLLALLVLFLFGRI